MPASLEERPLYNSSELEFMLDPSKAFEVFAALIDHVREQWWEANKSR